MEEERTMRWEDISICCQNMLHDKNPFLQMDSFIGDAKFPPFFFLFFLLLQIYSTTVKFILFLSLCELFFLLCMCGSGTQKIAFLIMFYATSVATLCTQYLDIHVPTQVIILSPDMHLHIQAKWIWTRNRKKDRKETRELYPEEEEEEGASYLLKPQQHQGREEACINIL